jgi:hypothetical protein
LLFPLYKSNCGEFGTNEIKTSGIPEEMSGIAGGWQKGQSAAILGCLSSPDLETRHL